MYEKPGMGNRMAEEERKDFLANDRNKLLAHIEFINEKAEPNANTLMSNLVQIQTQNCL